MDGDERDTDEARFANGHSSRAVYRRFDDKYHDCSRSSHSIPTRGSAKEAEGVSIVAFPEAQEQRGKIRLGLSASERNDSAVPIAADQNLERLRLPVDEDPRVRRRSVGSAR